MHDYADRPGKKGRKFRGRGGMRRRKHQQLPPPPQQTPRVTTEKNSPPNPDTIHPRTRLHRPAVRTPRHRVPERTAHEYDLIYR